MALEESGYKLVLQGYQQFIAGLGKISSDAAKMGSAMDGASKKVEAAGTKVANSQARYQAALKNTERASNNLTIRILALATAQDRAAQAARKSEAVEQKQGATAAQIASAEAKLEEALRAVERAQLEVANAGITHAQTQDRQAQAAQQLSSAVAEYLNVVDNASAATTQSTSTMTELGMALGALKVGLGLAIGAFGIFINIVSSAYNAVKNLVEKGINLLIGALRTLGNIVDAVLKPFGNILQGIFSVAGGMALYNVIRSIGQAFQDLIGDLQETLSYFQRLDIQLQALQARDLAEKFGIGMSEAFRLASTEAEKLRDWVIQLAVTTPFTVKSISTTLAMANAMGLNINMAKELTVATGNFTAAMGLTDEHMYRIIYNFAQMLTQGKLNKREFRDLANSMVPAMRILDEMAKKAGKSTKEFQKLAFEGGVPVEAFLKEFIRMANEDFPGAMKRMARTFEGVKNNIIDFIQTVIGLNVLGPTFNRITEHAANALDKLLTPAVRNAAYAIGQILLSAFKDVEASFNRFWNALGNVAEALGIANYSAVDFAISIRVLAFYLAKAMQWAADQINKSVGWIGQTFATISNNAGRWGYNIIAMLAKGMAAAAKLVSMVINNIVKMIAWFLEAFSPPRALPDLPKWGMAAMRSYLEGFTEADFSVLEGIQGPIEQALGILEKTGQIGKGDLGTIYRDISMAIARVISTGEGEAELFDMISRKIKVFGGDIAKLARLELELARATEMVRLAEKAVDDARKAEETSRAKVSKEIREYNDLLTAGADKSILNAKLAAINADEKAAAAATVQRKEAEAQLESVKALMEGLEEQVNLQKSLIDQLIDITEKQILDVDTSAADDLTDSLGSAGDAAEDLALDMEELFGTIDEGLKEAPKFAPLMEDWSVQMEDALAQAQLDWDNFWKDMDNIATTSGLKGSFDEISGSINELITLSGQFWDEIIGREPKKGAGGDLFSPTAPNNLDNLKLALKDLGGTAKYVWDNLVGIADNLGRIQKALSDLGLIDSKGPFTGIADGVQMIFAPITFAIGLFEDITDGIATILEYAIDLKTRWPEIWAGIVADFGKTVESIKTKWTEGWSAVWVALEIKRLQIKQTVEDLGSQIWTAITTAIEDIKRDWNAGWQAVWTALDQKKTEINATITTMLQTAKTTITTKLGEIKTEWDRILNLLMTKVKEIFENPGSVVTKIKKAVDDIANFFKVTLPNAINGFIDGALKTLSTKLAGIAEAIQKVKDAWEKIKNLGTGGTTTDPDDPTDGKVATGGRVQKGRSYIVGEKGWEYFFPGVSGWIANQSQISKMVASSMRNLATIPRINAQPIMSQNILNFNMGGVVVSSPITLAQIEAVITSTIRREFS